jgi:glycosyltransferase involved in cell wall biosynthesis
MPKALVLATAGLKSCQMEDKNNQYFPRVDYLELKRYIDIDIINYDVYDKTKFGGSIRFVETQIRSDLYLTILGAFALKRYSLIFTMSERAGIPFAGLKKWFFKDKHLFTMFQSWSSRQEKIISRFRLFNDMNTVAVHCNSMKKHLSNVGFSDEKIVRLPYSVDQVFFSPRKEIEQEKDFLVTVGEPRSRNYSMLFKVIEHLPVRLLAAASGWWYAREKKSNGLSHVPKNVEIVKHLPPSTLRTVYARSSFIVLPVYDQVSSAGITAILEAGCMERCVIATRSRGINEFVIHGETGIIVEQNDITALREAISHLLSSPEEARRMGRNARQYFESAHNWENYVKAMAKIIDENL